MECLLCQSIKRLLLLWESFSPIEGRHNDRIKIKKIIFIKEKWEIVRPQINQVDSSTSAFSPMTRFRNTQRQTLG